jgi:hypothetical protein
MFFRPGTPTGSIGLFARLGFETDKQSEFGHREISS